MAEHMAEPAVVRPPAATEYETSHADEIASFLIDAYGASMRIRTSDERRLMRHRRVDAGAFAIESTHLSADLDFEVEPLTRLVITRTSTARMNRASGGADRRYGTGELFILSQPGQPYTARRMAGGVQNCVIHPALLPEVAAVAPARRPGPIRFTSLDPHTPAAAARWWATRTYVAGLLADPQGAAIPLLIASAAQLLAAVTLATFPNTALTDPTIADRHDAHPATLRRAVAFIDEHAHQDITVADIAAAAFVTVRAVQLAFRRHMATTPMAYLRRVRLEHAHRDLAVSDSRRESVTAVAYRWGFCNPSRFATAYRQAYGVPPSHTLHHD